jgi:hemerythrin superfamily protein
MNRMQEVVGKVGEMFTEQDDKTDVVSLLKNDHRKVEMLFTQWENSRTAAKKQELLHQIIKELTVHATVEEDIVYPILEGSDKKKTSEKAREAEEEHHLLKMALAELADVRINSDSLKAKVTVVRELVRHHVKEEEGELLPALKRSGEDLEELGRRVMRRKQQLLGAVARGGGIGKNKDRKALATTSRSKNIASSKSKPRTKTAAKKAGVSKAASTKKVSTAKRSASSSKSRTRKTSSRRKSA